MLTLQYENITNHIISYPYLRYGNAKSMVLIHKNLKLDEWWPLRFNKKKK
jgi:hypothetical protein